MYKSIPFKTILSTDFVVETDTRVKEGDHTPPLRL